MKISKTLPTEGKGQLFFERYAPLIPKLILVGYFAQLISGFTEFGVFYTSAYISLLDFFPSSAPLLAVIFATIFTLFIELGGRLFLAFLTIAFLNKLLNGLDLLITILLGALVFFCLSISIFSSWKGSPEIAENVIVSPTLATTDKVNATLLSERQLVFSTYTADSNLISNNYNNQITSINNEYAAKVDKQNSQIDLYKRKEQREGKSYKSKKAFYKGKIADIKSEEANKIFKLESAKSDELKELLVQKKSSLTNLNRSTQEEKKKIDRTNNNVIAKAESKKERYGNGLGIISIIAIIIFCISVVLQQIYFKGSGIKTEAKPNDYFFRQSIISDFTNMVGEKIQYKLRSRIQTMANSTPAPPLPIAPPTLYDLSKAEQQRIQFEMAKKNNEKIFLQFRVPGSSSETNQDADSIPNQSLKKNENEMEERIMKYTKAYLELKNCNLDEQAKEMELKADDVIKAYLGIDASSENVNQLKEQIIGFFKGENENPFHTKERRQIGFNKNAKTRVSTEPEIIYIEDKYTVPHQQENGKTIHVNHGYILGKINTYSTRLKDSFEKVKKYEGSKKLDELSKHKTALKNREEKLNYWILKKMDLLQKVRKT